jgi:tetratricopeptide (TPR) repeat protein
LALGATLLLAAQVAGATPPAPPRARPDPDAIREVSGARPAGRLTSPRAVAHYLEARRCAVMGDLAGAAEALRRAVAYDAESAELRAAHAEALALTGQVEAAEAEARRAVALDGEGRAATAGHLLLARIHAARQELARAALELAAAQGVEAARARDGEAGDPEPWRLASEQRLEAGDAAGALEVLDAGVRSVGDDGEGYRELGQALLERQELQRAEVALRRALAQRRDDAGAWKLLAEVHEALGRPSEARDDLLALLRLDPDDEDALLGMGRLALRADEVALAREWFGRFLALAGDSWEPHLRVAHEWLDASHPAQALAAARLGLALPEAGARLRLVEGLALLEQRRWDEAAAVLGLVPPAAAETWVSARSAQAYALSLAGRHEEALDALAPVLAAHPGEPRLAATRAKVLGRSGRAGEAASGLLTLVAEREAAGDLGALSDLYPALTEALARAGRTGEAVAALERAAAAHPRDLAILYALGTAYERAGRSDAAVAQMQALLILAPDHVEALNFIGFTWAEQGVRLEEAEVLIRRALLAAPRSGHIVDSLGWVRFRRGDAAEAVALLERAERLSGPDPAVLDHLGDAYRAVGRGADAAAAWRRAQRHLGEELPAEQVALRAALERKLAELEAEPARRAVAR